MINHPQPPIFVTRHIKDTEISLFKSIADKNPTIITLENLIWMIRDGECKVTIDKLRETVNQAEKDQFKRSLPAVTVSGVFKDGHKAGDLGRYSGLIQIDFDKLESPEADFETLIKDPYTLAAFISPSGNGLKIIVRVSGTEKDHKTNFLNLAAYYLKRFGMIADQACKDVSRLMYISYDPNLYFNPESIHWSLEAANIEKFETVLNFIQRKNEFTTGKRNEYVFKLALECSAQKIESSLVKAECLKRFKTEDFTEFEIQNSIQSAYSYPAKKPANIQDEKLSKLSLIEKRISEWYDLRFNEVASRIEFRDKGTNEPYKELKESSLWRKLANENFEVSPAKLATLLSSDFVETYNPFQEYFNQLGKYYSDSEPDHIADLCRYIKCEDQERYNRQFKKMLVRTVACAMDPNVFNKQAFILVQDKQNSGKSTFCRWLCPPYLAEYIAENISMDKDSLIALTTNFIINLDELATLGKAEINMLKSFFSLDRVKVRLPFDRRATSRPRCASFLGSTNQDEFLTDETGSVRWLCFKVLEIDFRYKQEINIDQIWKQAFHLYQSGFAYQLTPAEVKENEIANRDFQRISAEREFIQQHFSPGTKDEHDMFVQATTLQQFGAERNFKLNPVLIGKAMKVLDFPRDSKFNGVYQVKGYFIKLNKPGSFTLPA